MDNTYYMRPFLTAFIDSAQFDFIIYGMMALAGLLLAGFGWFIWKLVKIDDRRKAKKEKQ